MYLGNENFENLSLKPIETDQYNSSEDMIGSSQIRQRRPVANNASSSHPPLDKNPFGRKFLLVTTILLVLFNNKASQPNDRFQPNDGSQLNDGSQPNNGFQSNQRFKSIHCFHPNDGVASIVKMANLSSEKFSLLNIPATDELNELRFAVRNLKVTMEKSRVIVEHSKPISTVLDDLDKNIHDTVDELRKFQHKAEWFFWLLVDELRMITQEYEKLHSSEYDPNLSDNIASFIHKRLESLETQISGFHEQFQRVSYAVHYVQKDAMRTREHLIEAKREAENALKDQWLVKLISQWINITDPKIHEMEEELDQVNFIKKLLEDFDRNFIDFGDFLIKYRLKIREVIVQADGIPTKPTAEYISYLKKAAQDLEKQHLKLFSKESIGHDSK
ncbi:24095_t:CDS:2 [Dentiscutata erythropus]|uniref:24095_t:CDS:1 n=1 Tax=Dentiscutata erythropus TaxID=1348616 RepID=A0A9N9DBX4_9GLOM|nr:24095_t:CDS:2 [Dentiscutata erythropus]